jgi:hypothetical protein
MKRLIRSIQILCLAVIAVAIVSPAMGANFKKMDAQGKELPDDAAQWDITLDKGTGLYWEVKKEDESIHSNKSVYKFNKSKVEFLAKLNEEKFGGFSDWRLPDVDELTGIKKKGKEAPFIDLNYFPHTVPSRYMSMEWCGSKSEYQPASVKFGKTRSKGGKYVRAVRGKDLEE